MLYVWTPSGSRLARARRASDILGKDPWAHALAMPWPCPGHALVRDAEGGDLAGTRGVTAQRAGDRIRHIWVVLNPDKLRPWRPG